ncbi:hypothetical protein HZS80_20775, partial [Halomonas glaciei]
MALKITVTDAGRAEIINAANTGTKPVEITHIAFTATAFAPSEQQTVLPGEIKRVASIAGEVVAPDTISVTAKDEGSDAYTVRGFGLITEFGTLFAVYGQAAPIIEKSSETTLLLTTDVVFADIAAASLTFGDVTFSNPPATETTKGVVEKATEAEAKAGSNNKFPDAAGVLAAFQQFGLGVAGNTYEQPLLPNFHNSTIRAGFYRWSESETENAPSVGGGGAIRLDRGGNRAVWIAASSSGSSNEPELYFKSTGFEVGTWGGWRKMYHTGNGGTGSGMDADQLDGQEGNYYRDASNLNAGTMPAERLPASTETKLGGVEKATEAEAKA